MEENMNYASALEELQEIVSEIENGQITVDVLSDKVKRASSLIRYCKQKLSATEEDVTAILREMEAPD